MKQFNYDYTGTMPDNRFKEQRTVLSNDNSDRVIMLEHAPFFPDLIVTVGDVVTPLKRGVDYELVHQLTPLEEIAADDLFCGVQLLSPHLAGGMTFEGQTVGGDFVDCLNGILDDLVKHLNTPLTGDWKDVNGVPTLMPKAQTYREWSDLLNTHHIADAIDALSGSVSDGSDVTTGALDALKVNIAMLSGTLDQFNYPGHIAAKNPHNTTATQLDAHPKNLAVSDAFMAYSKDFFALCDYVRQRGLTEDQLNEYISEYVTGIVEGTFTFDNDVALISSEDRSVRFDMRNGNVSIVSKGHLFFQADMDTVSASESYQIVSGSNILKVKSNAGAMSPESLTLNGVELITNRNIMEYQGSPGGGDVTSIVTSSSTLIIEGDGSVATPIRARLILHTASETQDGCIQLKDTRGTETTGWAVTPAAAKPLYENLQLLVPDTRRLNDKELKGSGIVINKDDAKLGKVDNTADMVKPLSDDLLAAINSLALSNHKHQWAAMGIGHAVLEEEGIALIANDVNALPDNQAVEPYVLNIVKGRLDALRPRYENTLVATDVEFATVSESAFSISGFRLTPAAPIEYSVSKGGVVTSGTFSGAIDLAAISDSMYPYTENDCDVRWPKAKLRPISVEVPDEACKWIAPEENWAPPVDIIFAVKKRLLVPDDEGLQIHLRSDDDSIFYIDGEEVGRGSNNINTIVVNVPAGRHTFAAQCRQNSSGTGTAIAFAIYAHGALVGATDDSWACEVLGETVDPTNNRFYIYGDVSSGNLIATAAPIAFGVVSGYHVFLGCVNTNYTQAIPNNDTELSFKSTIDYGMFGELDNHLIEYNAHGGNGSNIIVGLENVKGFGEAGGSTCMDTPCRFETTDATKADIIIDKSITMARLVSPRADTQFRLLQYVLGHCPARSHCVSNPLAEGMYTIEGILHTHATEDVFSSYQFITKDVNGEHRGLSVKYDPNTSLFTFRNFTMATMMPSAVLEDWTTYMEDDPIVPTVSNITSGSFAVLDPEIAQAKNQHLMLRYRYRPESNVLTLMASQGGVYTVADFVFPTNLSAYFNSNIIGFEGKGATTHGGVMDAFSIPYNDLKRVTNYRTLIECYLDGNDSAYYAENGIGNKVIALKAGCWVGLESWHGGTDVTHYPKTTGEFYTTTHQVLPAMFLRGSNYQYHRWPKAVIDTRPGTPLVEGASWINPSLSWSIGATREIVYFRKRLNFPTGVGTIVAQSDDSHNVAIDGVSIGTGNIGTAKTYPFNVTPGEHTVDFEVTNIGGAGGGACVVKDGATVLAKSDNTWSVSKVEGDSEFMLHINPWHTCQSAWDAALVAITKE